MSLDVCVLLHQLIFQELFVCAQLLLMRALLKGAVRRFFWFTNVPKQSTECESTTDFDAKKRLCTLLNKYLLEF